MADYDAKKLSRSDLNEFVGQIVNAFEDFLDEKGISIDNCEKEESEGACNIYGTDYGYLQAAIGDIVVDWGIAEKDSATKKYALVEFATLSDRYIYGEDVSYRSYVGDRGDYDVTFLKDFCDLNEALDALYAMEDSCSWYDDGRYIVRAYGVSELDGAGLYTGDIIYG